MATLTGNTIKDTYKSLIKVNDNGELAASLQEITDGYGNGSGVSLNTAGDLKAEGTIEFGSIKDTAEDITITKFVDEADGIANNDNDTTIPTSAAIVDYVASRITLEDLDFAGDTGTGSVDLDSQTLNISGTTNQIETTASGQSVTFAFPSAGVVLPDGSTATTQATTDDSTKVATTAYVKSVLTQEDLDFQGDTGTGSVDLDSQVLDIAGGTGIDTAASGQTLTVNIDSTVATLTGTQTLTNKTIDADSNTITNLEVDNLKSGVLDTDLTTVSTLDDTLASAKAIKTYVDANITAQDLDITDGTTTSAVDLDSQTMTIQGTANEVEVSLTDQTFTVGLPSTINVNVTGAVTGNADTASTLQTARDIALSGDVVGSASFDGSANINISTTIQADSVALGTDTTGDYVANLGTGTGVTIGSNTGEGSQPTIAVNYGSTANTAVQGNTEITINGTANEIEITGTVNQALGGAPSYTIGLPDNVTIGGSLIVSNDLTVNGTTTTVNTQTLSVEDPLIALAIANAANSVDTGFYAKYSLDAGVTTKFAGLFKDASDTDTFKLFKGLEVEPTTTVNTAGTGYGLADLQVAGLEASTITKTGGASTEFLKADGSVDSNTYLTAESDTLDAVTTRGNTTSNSIQVGAATVTGDLTVDTNTLYVDSTNNRVGIGTLTPANDLHISSTSGTKALFERTGSTGAYIGLKDNSGSLVYLGDNNGTFEVQTAGSSYSTKLAVTSAGNVGIGTVSPSANIEINKGAEGEYLRVGGDDASNARSLRFTSSTSSGGSVGALHTIKANSTAGEIAFANGDGTIMYLKDGGNVGIGTTSPISYSNRTTLAIEDAWGGVLDIMVGGVSHAQFGTDNFSSGLSCRVESKDGIVFKPSNTERMRITSAGGIEIPNQNAINEIQFTGSEYTNIYSQTTSGFDIGTNSTSGTSYLRLLTEGTQRLKIDSSGLVKIGSGTGTSSLKMVSGTDDYFQIDSTGSVTNIIAGNDSVGSAEMAFYTASAGTESERMKISSGGDISFRDGSANEAFYWDASAASLGIGTTSPTRELEVQGSGNVYIRVAASTDNDSSAIELQNTQETWTIANSDTNDDALEFISSTSGDILVIEKTGNVGIGTASPAQKAHIYESAVATGAFLQVQEVGGQNAYFGVNTSGGSIQVSGANPLQIATNGTERLRIDSSGILTVTADSSTMAILESSGVNSNYKQLVVQSGGDRVRLNAKTISGTSTSLTFETDGNERMRITSGGDLYIGTGSNVASPTQGGASFVVDTNDRRTLLLSTQTTSANSLIIFYNTNGAVGTIQTSGSATSYNTSSDYRLKENVVELTGALDRVDALKPSRFNFIADPDKTVDGFLAHEVADVVPEAITGEKDAMRTEEYEVSPAVYEDVVHPAVEEVLDEDGNVVTPAQEAYTEKVLVSEAVMGTREVPEYQGIDQSKLVPVLTAALQEAHALIKDLTARVEALESN